MARKRIQETHLELRYNTYYAVLYVPKDVVPTLQRTKFSQSTKTGDKRIAVERAKVLVFEWKRQIQVARHESLDPFIESALSLRSYLKENDNPTVKEIIEDETLRITEENGEQRGNEFAQIVFGKQDPIEKLLTTWKSHQAERELRPKTIDQWSRDIELLIPHFKTASSITPRKAETWIKFIASEADLTPSSVNRIVAACNNFYRYLKTIGQVPAEVESPFSVPTEFKTTKSRKSKGLNKQKKWLPFTPEEVVDIYQQAIMRNDQTLADLIYIAAYTGARIEEICSLKLSDVDLKKMTMKISEAKTDAGTRVVPIHDSLETLVKKLSTTSNDGYLLSGLTFNKYGDRSNAIGKRFGRLKKLLKHSEQHVFHSIRKTFTTQLEDKGVSENLAADIVGHEKPRITYGLYSGGASIDTKREAINKVNYTNWESNPSPG